MVIKIRGRSIKYRLGLGLLWSGLYKDGNIYVSLISILRRKSYTKHIVAHEETHRIVDGLQGVDLPSMNPYEEEVATELVASVLSGEQISSFYMMFYGVGGMDDDRIDKIVRWAHFLLTTQWGVPISRVYLEWLIEPHRNRKGVKE
jgi:hypothetical protein